MEKALLSAAVLPRPKRQRNKRQLRRLTGVKGGRDMAKQVSDDYKEQVNGNPNDSRAESTRLAFDELSCIRCKLSPHNGDKGIKGLATKKIDMGKYDCEEVESVIIPRSEKFPNGRIVMEAVVLQSADEIRLSNAMGFGLDEDNTGRLCERVVKAPSERPSDE
jgi:hypothetical protein